VSAAGIASGSGFMAIVDTTKFAIGAGYIDV
jgi:hypothetical protein